MRYNTLVITTVFFSLILGSCGSRNKQPLTNKLYEQQVRQLASEMTQELPAPNLKALEDADPDFEEKTRLFDSQKPGKRSELSWVGAIHFDNRKPNFVIIHPTAQDSLAQTVRTFTLAHTKVSAHYVIGRKGEVLQMLNDYLRGWHAGSGRWGNITDLNSISLGIELDNNGSEPFPEVQINALMNLLDTLKTNYNIPSANFIGHADIAPTRKNDPSVLFPWETLAKRGFGLWYDENSLMTPPDNFNAEDALRIIGYDTRNLKAAIVAFKRKFIKTDLKPELNIYDKAVLYNLYKKY